MKNLFSTMWLIVVILIASGCASDEQRIIGKWRSSEQQVWDFRSDHTLQVSDLTKSKIFGADKVSPRISNKRQEDFIIKWVLNDGPNPNHLDLLITEAGTTLLTIYSIQEFTGENGMRIGVDGAEVPRPSSFEQAGAVVTFVRQ